jgi:hypothetical protein
LRLITWELSQGKKREPYRALMARRNGRSIR